MKLRFAPSALVFLVAMTMATGAFAQGIFTLSNNTVPRGRNNGHAELAGDITLFLTTGDIDLDLDNDAPTGTVTIDYGVPITNSIGDRSVDADSFSVTVCAADLSALVAADANPDENGVTLSSDGTTLTINVETCPATQGADEHDDQR